MESNHFIIIQATLDTLTMVFSSGFLSFLIGIPIGIILFLTGQGKFLENVTANKILNIFTNIGRSVPFIILLVAIIPFTRLITGSSIGTIAAIVPLTVSSIPFVARITEGAIAEVSPGLIEAAQAMGATPLQIIRKVLLPEALPSLIHGITLTLITLVGYTAMAGAVGGGGLGAVAINFGYNRFNTGVMLETVVILVIIVQLIQWIGDKLQKHLTHRS